jgi:cytochrome c oxidase subunit 2
MDPGFQLFPDQASSFAPNVDALYAFLLVITAFFTVSIFLAILFLAIYYRRSAVRNRKRHVGAKLWILEALWIVVPLILTMVMFLWGAAAFFEQRVMPEDAIEISVVGKQWMWKIQHPQGRSEINELHVPVGQPIVTRMISEDVIHSFYLPAFRVKMDVLPNRYTSLWFQATKTGTYHLFCAEYCGTEHADMRGSVVVMQPAEYAEWLEGGRELPPATAGQELFARHRCDTCHNESTQARGPSLTNLFSQIVRLADGSEVIADEAYLRESIMNPAAKVVAGYQPVMPTFDNQLSEEQVFHLIEYIKSLSVAPTDGGQAAPGDTSATQPPAPGSTSSPQASPQPQTSLPGSDQNSRRPAE